jgi:hypothetical protein
MAEVLTQARLVDFGASRFSGGGLGTTIPRAEIVEAAERGEYPARLDLDVDRMEATRGEEASEPARVGVEWDQATLEQLLQSTDDEEVVLWFDSAELARAIEGAEVDAHGLRERAAAVVVAVAATGVTAGGGLAAPIAPGGQAVIPDLPAGMTLSDRGSPPRSESAVSADAFGPQSTAPAGRAVIPDLPAGQTLSPAGSVGARGSASSPAEAAVSAAADSGTQLPGGGRAVIPDLPSGMTLEPPATPVAEPSGDSISLPSPAETAGIAAGVGLLITAAGFAAVRSRTRPSRPA